MKSAVRFLVTCLAVACCLSSLSAQSDDTYKIPVLIDTDANNELDDQHALAYLFFNGDIFDLKGVTVNATDNGGNIEAQMEEAERVLRLCNVYGEIPLIAGADADFEEILPHTEAMNYDGKAAVDFIIEQARAVKNEPLVLLPVGKLTNVALALAIAPDIKNMVRIVWLGSNYPEPGEYNEVNDMPAVNYILKQEVPFEIVTVRYGKTTGSGAVSVQPHEILEKMPGLGVACNEVEGRHGEEFANFGDYSVNLFEHAEMYGEPPSRSLYDMVAVAIVKNSNWGERRRIPAPVLLDGEWQDKPDNTRKIILWENFNRSGILNDFYQTLRHPVVVD